MEYCRVLPRGHLRIDADGAAQADATDNTSLVEYLSETDFYLGKLYLSFGDNNVASALFKLTVANNVQNFVEHRYILLELALLGQGQDDLSESDQQ